MLNFAEQASEGILQLSENVNDAAEPELVPEGDYTLEIHKAEMHKSEKTQNVSLHVVFKIHDSGVENPMLVHKYFGLPTPEDEKEKANNKKLMLKRFFTEFGIEQEEDGSVDLAKLDGLTGEAHLGIEEGSEEFPDKNRISRFGTVRR